MSLPSAGRLSLIAVICSLLGQAALAQTTAPPPPVAAGTPAAPAAQPPPDPTLSGLVFDGGKALVLNPIKPDKTSDFEALLVRLRVALLKSADPVRRQQAESWQVLKAAEPGPGGSVLYVFVLDPAVKGADYTVSRLLAEAFPDETEALWTKLADAYAGGMHVLRLQAIPVTPVPPSPPR